MIQEKAVCQKKSPFCSCIFGHKSSKSAVSARNICGKPVLHVEYAEEKANAQKLEQRVTRMNESRRLIKTKPNKKANREPSSNRELCELERKSCSDNTSQVPQLTLVAEASGLGNLTTPIPTGSHRCFQLLEK